MEYPLALVEGAKLTQILVIGQGKYEQANSVNWTQPFPNIEECDCLIIDINSFPKIISKLLLENLKELGLSILTLLRTGREIFCIIDEYKDVNKDSNIFAKLNYIWFEHYENLSITKKIKGKSKNILDARFSNYLDNVEEWEYELYWTLVKGYSYKQICTNKSGKTIALKLQYKNVGSINFLPRTTKISISNSINILIDIILGKEAPEYSWRKDVEIPLLKEILLEINQRKDEINTLNKGIVELKDRWQKQESYRDLFSKDDDKVPKAVKRILKDIGISTHETKKGDVVDLKNKDIAVEITSIKDKIKANTKKITQLSRFIEEERKNEKVVLIVNTYKEISINERINKKHISDTMTNFFISTNVCFIPTITLYNLWLKVINKDISHKRALKLIYSTDGELII